MAPGQAASNEGDGDCLDDETLALLLEGVLDEDEDAKVRAHLDTCVACRRLFAEAARAIDADPAITGATRVRRTGTSSEYAPGDLLAGKYRVERALGEGGMGRVLAARHVDLDQLVALKVLQPDLVGDPDVVRRFAREAKAAAALKSEHAARIFDVGRLADDTPYMVMEYLDGRDLAVVLEEDGPLPIAEAIDYVLQACDALSEAHDLGIVHRDLKPHNLFLVNGANVKVLDFGLAKAPNTLDASDNSMTGTNMILGSPFFMSPEQVAAKKDVDRRTDVWSLGATLYQLVTGVPPFVAPTIDLLCQLIAVGAAPTMTSRRAGVPKALEEVVAKCLAKDPAARYSTMRDLERALHGVLEVMERSEEEINTAPIATGAREPGDRPRGIEGADTAFDARVTVPRDETATIVNPLPPTKTEIATIPLLAAPRPSRTVEDRAPPPPPAPRSALVPIFVVGTFALAAIVLAVALRMHHTPIEESDPLPRAEPANNAAPAPPQAATSGSATPEPSASASSAKRPRVVRPPKSAWSSRTPYDHP